MTRAPTPAVVKRLAVVLALGLAPLAGARAETSIPYPEIDDAEPLVRQQLESARAEHDALVADGTQDVSVLANSYGRLAELYHAYDLSEAAEAAYSIAVDLAPGEFRWLYLSGFLRQTEGRREESVETLRRALALNDEDIPTLLRLASQQLELGAVDAAERLYHRVLELQPTAAAALQGLGRLEAERGRHEASAAAFEQALIQAPYADHLRFLAAMAYRRLGDLERARDHFELKGPTEVVFEDPLVARMRARATGSAMIQHRGFLAESAGLPEQAMEAYRRAIEADPSNAEARRGLASALQQSGDLDTAIEEYRNLLRVDTNPAAAHFMLAGALQEKGLLDEALTHFKAAVELEPGYRMFGFRLASALMDAGDLQAAEVQFRSLIELDPGDVSGRFRLGQVLALEGRDEEALDHFEKVVQRDASRSLRAAAYDAMARLLVRTGDGSGAIEAFEKALELDPSLVDTRFALANVRGRAGALAAAAADYRLVVEQIPQHVPARLGEATALLLVEREAEAIERLEEGLVAVPDNPAIAGALARLLATSSDPSVRDGLRALELGLALYRESGSLEHGETVAMALAELGRFEEAIDWQSNLLAQARRLQESALAARLTQNLERYRSGRPARTRDEP